MGRKCLKCGYERTSTESVPEYECPKCGAIYAKVELAMGQSTEANNNLSDEEKIRAIKERTAIDQQMRQAKYRKQEFNDKKKKSTPRYFTKTNQVIAVAGALVLLIGVFSPIIHAPIVGNINIFNQGKGDGGRVR